MIGELLRKEAEIAVGPLTITAEREQVMSLFHFFFNKFDALNSDI